MPMPKRVTVQVFNRGQWVEFCRHDHSPATGEDNPIADSNACYLEAALQFSAARVVDGAGVVLWPVEEDPYDATPEPGARELFRAWQRNPADWGRR